MRLALVHVCGKQMPSASISLLNANLLYVYDSKMYRRVCSGSVHTVGTCTRMWLCGADFRLKNVFDHKIRPKSALRSGILFTSFKVVHRPRSVSPLHFDSQHIPQSYRKNNASARRLLLAALLERWPHVCRVKITFTLLQSHRLVSERSNLMKYLVHWIPLRIRVRSRNTQPYLSRSNDTPHWLILLLLLRKK